MSSVNKALIIGHLGRDPDLRYTSAGKAVCNFSVATSEVHGKGQDRKETTEWHSIVCWEKTAENCGQYLKKGSKVYVEGRITTRKWQDKEGRDRQTTEIVAREVVFLSTKDSGGGGTRDSGGGAPPLDDADIPF